MKNLLLLCLGLTACVGATVDDEVDPSKAEALLSSAPIDAAQTEAKWGLSATSNHSPSWTFEGQKTGAKPFTSFSFDDRNRPIRVRVSSNNGDPVVYIAREVVTQGRRTYVPYASDDDSGPGTDSDVLATSNSSGRTVVLVGEYSNKPMNYLLQIEFTALAKPFKQQIETVGSVFNLSTPFCTNQDWEGPAYYCGGLSPALYPLARKLLAQSPQAFLGYRSYQLGGGPDAGQVWKIHLNSVNTGAQVFIVDSGTNPYSGKIVASTHVAAGADQALDFTLPSGSTRYLVFRPDAQGTAFDLWVESRTL